MSLGDEPGTMTEWMRKVNKDRAVEARRGNVLTRVTQIETSYVFASYSGSDPTQSVATSPDWDDMELSGGFIYDDNLRSFIAPIAGLLFATGNVNFTSASDPNNCYVALDIDGVQIKRVSRTLALDAASGGSHSINIATILRVDAGSAVGFRLRVQSGTNTYMGDATTTWLDLAYRSLDSAS